MDEVKRKVFFDLIGHPATLLPVTGGLTGSLVGFALGWPILIFGGMLTVAGGIAFGLSRFVFNLENMTEQAYQLQHESRIEAQNQELNELDEKLAKDNDKRTHRSLRQLRDMYRQFQEDVETGKITGNVHSVLSKFEDLFDGCVESLKIQLYIYEDIRDGRIQGKAKKQALGEREKTIQEVIESVDFLERLVAKYHSFNARRNDSDLSKLREELDMTLQAAEKAERLRATGFEDKGYDAEKFRNRARSKKS